MMIEFSKKEIFFGFAMVAASVVLPIVGLTILPPKEFFEAPRLVIAYELLWLLGIPALTSLMAGYMFGHRRGGRAQRQLDAEQRMLNEWAQQMRRELLDKQKEVG